MSTRVLQCTLIALLSAAIARGQEPAESQPESRRSESGPAELLARLERTPADSRNAHSLIRRLIRWRVEPSVLAAAYAKSLQRRDGKPELEFRRGDLDPTGRWIVPLLVVTLPTAEEFEAGRIADRLSTYGELAASAVPALLDAVDRFFPRRGRASTTYIDDSDGIRLLLIKAIG